MVTKSNGVILGKTSLRGNTKCIHFLFFSFVFLCFLLFSSAFSATKSNGVILGKTGQFLGATTPLLLVARYFRNASGLWQCDLEDYRKLLEWTAVLGRPGKECEDSDLVPLTAKECEAVSTGFPQEMGASRADGFKRGELPMGSDRVLVI